ncbi:hypothetical protein ASPWEDRAFT_41363 [Aspergillus wentii DTO 134E9]|uniref:Glycosyltransferase 2-like domain-containing protein n=1 Tax=Aspergillus wentii DTO 134E9 TaxID=1073089 RepID=A0A1L9RMH4_ASPWE|nr:uncharacterized protein ASPWEDRAFT_41363 [Aspergillus wentii DTO 134E9]KAI9929425.1 hypothetical protein MW887_000895 [Aspergillus wentii]OJJ36131.1 hypothetical protein ASPWEDRAFT_41363 [Aspergillus wentii DTO 134E9]
MSPVNAFLELVYQANYGLRLFRLFWIALIYYGFHRHRSTPVQREAAFSTTDASIVCPSVDPERDFVDALRSWLANNPKQIFVVTTPRWFDKVSEFVNEVNDPRVTVHRVEITGKRPGLVEGIKHTTTPAVVLLDDDVIWSPNTLEGLLLSLSEARDVGGVTPIKNNKNQKTNALEAVGASRLDRRSVTNAAMAQFCNGQVFVCTGRTSAYRTEILQDPEFTKYFTGDLWMGKHPLRSGDDVAITSWLQRKGWRTGFVSKDDYAIISRPKQAGVHLGQVLRWQRNRIRQVLRDIGNIFSDNPGWYRLRCFYSLLFPSMVEDYLLCPDFLTVLVLLVARGLGFAQDSTVIPSASTLVLHYFGFSALYELVYNSWHFYHCPQSLWQLPTLAVWGHVRVGIALYALFTTSQSNWLTRIGAD